MLEKPADQVEITSIERQKRSEHRYNIFVNETFAFSVHEDVLVKHRLAKGQWIAKSRMEEIFQDEERQKALNDALKYIGRKPRSVQEVTQKLKLKGFETTLIESVIRQLTDHQYLDDESFAKSWAEHRILNSKRGRQWVRQELKMKGVAKEKIGDALQAVSSEAEYNTAMELAVKRLKQICGEPRDKQRKLAQFLLRRGYPNSMVAKVVREVGCGQEDSDDNNELTEF